MYVHNSLLHFLSDHSRETNKEEAVYNVISFGGYKAMYVEKTKT